VHLYGTVVIELLAFHSVLTVLWITPSINTVHCRICSQRPLRVFNAYMYSESFRLLINSFIDHFLCKVGHRDCLFSPTPVQPYCQLISPFQAVSGVNSKRFVLMLLPGRIETFVKSAI